MLVPPLLAAAPQVAAGAPDPDEVTHYETVLMTTTIDYRSMSTEQLKKRRDELARADEECGWTADQEMARVLGLEALEAALAERGEGQHP